MTQETAIRSILCGFNRPSLLHCATLVILGASLIAIGAKITVPLQPVPVTMQSLAVLFIAMTYGFRLGISTVCAYLLAGLLGLPMFAMMGALNLHAGYLFGFLAATALVGFLSEKGWSRHIFSTLILALLGSTIILCMGWGVLTLSLGASAAFAVGIKPFILADSLKIIFLTCVVPGFWRI